MSSILRCEATCYTIINYSNQEHPRITKSRYTKLWGDHPQCSSLSVRHFISKLPAPHANSSKRDCLLAGAFAVFGMLEWSFECCSDLQNHRRVMDKRHPRADTCAVEVCEMSDTLRRAQLAFLSTPQSARQELTLNSVSAAPVHSSLTVRFQAPFLLLTAAVVALLHTGAITEPVWNGSCAMSRSVWYYRCCCCIFSITEDALGPRAHFIPTF